MKTKRPTSFEVAKLAGVSRTTVSFVLNRNDKMSISAATKQRVLDAARELGYVPDVAGRNLASGRTRTLGLFICHAEHLRVDAFIPQALLGIHQASQEHGFRVIVEAVEDPRQPDAYADLVRARQVDGLVVLNPRKDDEQLQALILEDYPLVILGASKLAQAFTISTNDNSVAARRATEHLLKLGHTRVAHITYGSLEYQGVEERFQGYKQALEVADLPFDPALVREGDFSAESGFAAMTSLLETGTSFSALFASNDTVALGAMAALRARGVRIPEDVAVVGYDDIPLAPYAAPPLTTVRSPALEHGRLAAEMLIRLIRGEPVDRAKVTLDMELVVRSSCGASKN